jgi:NADPH:quinone reductase-like Zn-dependent oxidoreductase
MNAMVVREHGSPSVIQAERVAVAPPSVGQVMLKVKACALNHLDVWVRKGIPGIKLPRILGCDIAGEVVELGQNVSHLRIGDKVLVDPGISCGICRECLSGGINLCRFYYMLGSGRDGGYAEFVNVPAKNCFPIPQGLDFHQAAAIPLVFMTAWHMLVTRSCIKANEDILVVGAGSGVGSAAIQIAKLFHCRVIATAGVDEKAELAKSLGADHVIIHSRENIAEAVKKLTDKRGVDVVFEHVGPAVFVDCLNSLATNGRLVTCGATTGPKAEIDITRLFMKHQSILGSMMGTRRELMDVLPFFSQGLLKPVVHKVLPLSEAVKAHEMLEGRQQFGKIVLDPTI